MSSSVRSIPLCQIADIPASQIADARTERAQIIPQEHGQYRPVEQIIDVSTPQIQVVIVEVNQ